MKFIFFFLLISLSSVSIAETQWKFGLGVGTINANSYPGSGQSENITSPIPYLKIKTDWFDLDREGLHTHWFEQTRFRLDFSFDIGMPSSSEAGSVRDGMSDLNPVGQVGPMLIYQLSDTSEKKWQLQLPLLFAAEVENIDFNSMGYVINPRVYYNQLIGKGRYPLDFSLSLGPVYANSEYHAYYYDVAMEDVTASRSAFDSGSGFGGYRLNLSLTKRFDDYWAGVYLRYHNIDGAVFEQSPLVEQSDYWFIAVGVSWLFAGSL